MSRTDTHPPDFDYRGFANHRDFQLTAGTPHGYAFFTPRDLASSKDFWYSISEKESVVHQNPSRDSSFYRVAPASLQSGVLSSGSDGGRPSTGMGSMVSPRMYSQGSRVNGEDGWIPVEAGGGPVLVSASTMTASSGMAAPAAATNGGSPNSHRQTMAGSQVQLASQQDLFINHHHRSPPLQSFPLQSPTSPSAFNERDPFRDILLPNRQLQQQSNNAVVNRDTHLSPVSPSNASTAPRFTLWWGELEPWMDEEYVKQVCTLMGWDLASIKVPRLSADPATGKQANNPGYCFLSFPSQTQAASVLNQVNNGNGGNPLTMPNSSKPFAMNWASSVQAASVPASFNAAPTISIPGAQNPQYPREYSIFVGDLAPEVSNSDLVAVFRNPVLGLRNDREPRFIRPFLSCKSAKIMLDPVTGVSRGYGFVRFTDEADQQRALIEMHGLYCLSRPMRISPATAKFKSAPGVTGFDLTQMQFPGMMPSIHAVPAQQVNIPLPLPSSAQTKSVSTPLASGPGSNGSLSSAITSSSGSSLTTGSATSTSTLASVSSEDILKSLAHGGLANGGAQSDNAAATNSIPTGLTQPTQDQLMAQQYNMSEESWKHHAQARAILSNLIGPNGEQLSSSDPYNTTVFVGGLSPLISEDTLRTFFLPFGEIHYVKVPVGKHCGFVQFVRKPDAERAIEKMQGFPIGGSRIRLSWGRSQYKAAQAAAQAAQTAALQAQYQVQMAPQAVPPSITPEQALQLLEKFGTNQFPNGSTNTQQSGHQAFSTNREQAGSSKSQFHPSVFEQHPNVHLNTSAFSPFSPDPGYLSEISRQREIENQSQVPPTTIKPYDNWYPSAQQGEKGPLNSGKVSPTSNQTSRPTSARPFGNFLGESQGSAPYQGHRSRSSSRQDTSATHSEVSRHPQHPEQFGQYPDHDSLRDLNGTFANLSLGNNQSPWGSRAYPSSP